MPLTNAIQRIKSRRLSIFVWTSILLTTLSCVKFHVSHGVGEPATTETGEKLNPKELQDFSFARIMGMTISEANKGLVLHEFFKNTHLQDRWSRLCSSEYKQQCMSHVLRLIEDHRKTLGILNDNGFAPIHYAAQNLSLKDPNVIALFKLLLHYSKDYVNLLSNPRDLEPGNAPLHLAASYNGNPEIIQLLIDKGAEVDQKNDEYNTPLQLAAMHSHNPKIIQVLKDKNADLYQKDMNGHTLLHLAVMRNNSPAIIREIVNQGVKVDDENCYGSTALFLAIRYLNLPSIKALLNLDANLNKKVNVNEEDNNENTALHLAINSFIYKMRVDNILLIVRELLANGGKVNKKNNNGNTLLHEAAIYHNSLAVIHELIAKGVDVNEKNDEGQMPLHLAAMYANLVTTKQFSNRDNVNEKDNKGNTPLHLAVNPRIRNDIDDNHLAVVRELLTKGAEVNEQNHDKKTPLDIIGDNDRVKPLRALLEQYKNKGLKRQRSEEEKSQEESNDEPGCSKKKRKFNYENKELKRQRDEEQKSQEESNDQADSSKKKQKLDKE